MPVFTRHRLEACVTAFVNKHSSAGDTTAKMSSSPANTAITAFVSRSNLPLIQIDLSTSVLDCGLNELQIVHGDGYGKLSDNGSRRAGIALLQRANVSIPLPVENDSFNAQPEAPACPGPATKKAGASGWALNEQMCHSSPVGV